MGRFTLTHEIACTPEQFWKVFFDDAFNDALYKGHLGFPDFRVVEKRENDREIFRKVAGSPKMEVPAPVAKVLGSSFTYTEEGTFEKSTGTWRWKMTPSVMPDKLRNEGVVRVEAVGSDKCRRVSEVLAEAKIFGVGGMIESAAEKNLRDGWERSAHFMNQWIRDGRLK